MTPQLQLDKATIDLLWPVDLTQDDREDLESLDEIEVIGWENIDNSWVEHLR